MKYEKQALTFEVQADQLMARGLDADRKELVQRLSAVSYYRLAGYLHPYRVPDDQGHFSDQFYPGTSLTEVWRRYCFDRRLRGLVMDAIERIEVSVRTQLVYHFAHEHGPFGFCAEANIPKLKAEEYIDWRKALIEETRRSKEPFKKHFQSKYGGDHPNLPLWMVAELMSMGSLLTFFRGVSQISNERSLRLSSCQTR
jgi:abortive infection bacteriophage resistance protein